MMLDRLILMKWRLYGLVSEWRDRFFRAKSAGIDGILVTVGLCIIALVLCVVMKDSLTTFIKDLVENMNERAGKVLENGVPI